MSVGPRGHQLDSPASTVRGLMPKLREELAQLVAVPSISVFDYPEATRPALQATYELVVGMLRDAASRRSARSSCRTRRRSSPARYPLRRAPDGAAVLALRRRAGGRRVQVGVAAVRGERARRRHLRPRQRRLEVEHPHARRGAARLGREAARRHQDRDRGPGGDGQRVHDLPAEPSPAVRRRRDGDRRHGQRAPRRPDADRRPARHGRRHGRGANARRAEAQRPVRRRRARRAPGADPRAGEPARRQRRRRRGRATARGVDGSELQRRGVPLARRAAGRHAVHRHRRPRRAHLVRARADGDRTRCAARRCARECRRAVRASQDQRALPSRTGPARGSGGARQAPRSAHAVRDRDRGQRRRDGPGLLREDDRARLRGGTRGTRESLGRRDAADRDRRVDPARQRALRGSAGRRDPDVRDD